MKKLKLISPEHIKAGMNFESYIELSETLFAEGKTTGPKQSEALVRYTGLNLHRMKRLRKTYKLSDESLAAMQEIQEKQVWLVLTEAWCGDAAQILPIMKAFADASPLVDFKLLLRDENLDIMDAYLTNGGRSIPKLIMLNADELTELGTWGPRPAEAQDMYMEFKRKGEEPYDSFQKKLQIWYNKDKAASIEEELRDLVLAL